MRRTPFSRIHACDSVVCWLAGHGPEGDVNLTAVSPASFLCALPAAIGQVAERFKALDSKSSGATASQPSAPVGSNPTLSDNDYAH